MKKNTMILSMGILLTLLGIAAALLSFEPSKLFQYIFVIAAMGVGGIGILISRSKENKLMPSSYYAWIGFILVALSVVLVTWGTSLVTLAYVLGFFMIVLGIVEFIFVLQILNYHSPIPWNVVGIKLMVSATSAVGAAWILTMAGFDMYTALLFIGILFITVGMTVIRSAAYK